MASGRNTIGRFENRRPFLDFRCFSLARRTLRYHPQAEEGKVTCVRIQTP
jgi:hypothetical protein